MVIKQWRTHLKVISQLDPLVDAAIVSLNANQDGQPLVSQRSILRADSPIDGSNRRDVRIDQLNRPLRYRYAQIDELVGCLEGVTEELGSRNAAIGVAVFAAVCDKDATLKVQGDEVGRTSKTPQEVGVPLELIQENELISYGRRGGGTVVEHSPAMRASWV